MTMTMTKRRHVPAAAEMGTAQKLAQLATLRDAAGKSIYERIKLACEIRDDNEWVAQNFKGDLTKAEEHLQEEYLADLCDLITFGEAYRVYQAVPDIGDWQAHKFSLLRLHALMKERTPKVEGEKRTRRGVTLVEYEDLEDKKKDAEFALNKANEEISNLRAANAELRAENAELRSKVAHLEGRLAEVERRRN